MTHEITDDDRATARGIFATARRTGLFSHPTEPDAATEPTTPGNYVPREGAVLGRPNRQDDLRAIARDLFSN
jgi:hypothetical protein